MTVYLFLIVATFLLSLILTPIVRRVAMKFRVYATPNHRNVHSERIPRLGGLAIFIPVILGSFVFNAFISETEITSGLLIGMCIAVTVGLVDDIFDLNCYIKLVFQTFAAASATFGGFRVDTICLPYFGVVDAGLWALPISIFWIVTVMNALNLLDGLDGLASGFVVLTGSISLIVASMFESGSLINPILIVVAATLGFLRYNLPPAKIFMGDTGSLFLGFCLASLSLKSFSSTANGTHFVGLVLLFSIPLVDTAMAVLRRLRNGQHPFSPDKKHIHHRLLELGLNQVTAVVVICAGTVVLGITAIVLLTVEYRQFTYYLAGLGVISTVSVYSIRWFDAWLRQESRQAPDKTSVQSDGTSASEW